MEISSVLADISATVKALPTSPTGAPTKPKVSALATKFNVIDPHTEEAPPLRSVLFGDVGAGKTTLVCSGEKVLLLDYEVGRLSLKNHPEITAKAIAMTTFSDIVNFTKQAKAGEFDNYELIAVDTLTTIRSICLDERMKKVAAKDGNRDSNNPYMDDYGIINNMMRKVILNLTALPQDICFLTHTLEYQDETSLIYKQPDVTPMVWKTLSAIAGLIVYLEKTEKGERKLLISQRRLKSKSRLSLPDYVSNPKSMDNSYFKSLNTPN